MQAVLYDDAAASEVLSEWLSGSDVAVAASEAGSDAAIGMVYPFQPPFVASVQPSSAASTAGGALAASPPFVPHMLHFTPVAAAPVDSGWQGQGGMQIPGAAAAAATPSAAARLQQQWSQQVTPGSGHAAQQQYRDPAISARHIAGTYAASSVAQGTPQSVRLSPGSSSAVKQATQADSNGVQDLVLDIDIAKVLNSSGTIVLQVRRDETGALTAEAALAPAAMPTTPWSAAAAAAAAQAVAPAVSEVLATAGPLAVASPVLGSKGRAKQQGLPIGSISVEGSIGAACGRSQQSGSGQRQQQQGESEEQPVHRVLRYSAEGRISIGSLFSRTGPASDAAAGLIESLDLPATQQSGQSVLLGGSSDDESGAVSSPEQQPGEDEQEGLHLVHVPGPRRMGDASWVLVDIQPTQQHQGGFQVSSQEQHGMQHQQKQQDDQPVKQAAAPAAGAEAAVG
jgi:hypothetical protein